MKDFWVSDAYLVGRRPAQLALADGVVSLRDLDHGEAAERLELDVGHFDVVLDAEEVQQEQQEAEARVGFVPVDVAVVGVLSHVQLGDRGHVFVVLYVEHLVQHVDLRQPLELRVEEHGLQPRKTALLLQLDALFLDLVRAVPKLLLVLLQQRPVLQENTRLPLQLLLFEHQLVLHFDELRLFPLELRQPLFRVQVLHCAEVRVYLVVGLDELQDFHQRVLVFLHHVHFLYFLVSHVVAVFGEAVQLSNERLDLADLVVDFSFCVSRKHL